MAGIPRITRRTKAPAVPSAATEIMAEPVYEPIDVDDDGVYVDPRYLPQDIAAEPVYEAIDVDDDDYPEPPVSGEAGYTVSPDDDDDRPVMTAPLQPLPRPPPTYLDPPDVDGRIPQRLPRR